MPGGSILAGWGGLILIEGTSDFIDVANWELDIEDIYTKLYYSGSYGSTNRRIIAQNWTARCNVWFDTRNTTPMRKLNGKRRETILKKDCSVVFVAGHTGEPNPVKIGDPDTLGVIEQDESTSVVIPYYIAPMCVVTNMKTTNNNDDIVVQELTIEGNSLIWEITSTTDEADYDDYVGRLNTARRIHD